MASHAARHFLKIGVAGPGFLDQFGVRMASRILGVQTRLVGQDDQRVGFDQVGHECRQRIVVAEPDLVGGDRVVLVDHRDDTQVEQGSQGRARVEVAFAVRQVFMRQQDLRGMQVVLAETGFVGFDQAHLADGGGRLQFVERVRPALPAQPLHAFGNRAARHQHDILLAPFELGDLLGPARKRGVVEPLAFVRDEAAADLDDQASRFCGD